MKPSLTTRLTNPLFNNVVYIGFFGLGAYIGGLINYAIKDIANSNDSTDAIIKLIGAALAGSVMVFLQFLSKESFIGEDKKAIYMYPIGLITALLWYQAVVIYGEKEVKWMGPVVLIIIALLILTLIVLLFVKNRENE